MAIMKTLEWTRGGSPQPTAEAQECKNEPKWEKGNTVRPPEPKTEPETVPELPEAGTEYPTKDHGLVTVTKVTKTTVTATAVDGSEIKIAASDWAARLAEVCE